MQYDNETKNLIEQLDKQAKEIQVKIDELKNGESKCIRWRAKDNFTYYHVNGEGRILETAKLCNKEVEEFKYKTGNYFKTAEGAEKYKNNLIITQKLKDIALRLNNGVEIDWNKSQARYGINYDYIKNKLNTWSYENIHICQIYCLSDKFLETAIKEIGEQELIEYIKGR